MSIEEAERKNREGWQCHCWMCEQLLSSVTEPQRENDHGIVTSTAGISDPGNFVANPELLHTTTHQSSASFSPPGTTAQQSTSASFSPLRPTTPYDQRIDDVISSVIRQSIDMNAEQPDEFAAPTPTHAPIPAPAYQDVYLLHSTPVANRPTPEASRTPQNQATPQITPTRHFETTPIQTDQTEYEAAVYHDMDSGSRAANEAESAAAPTEHNVSGQVRNISCLQR